MPRHCSRDTKAVLVPAFVGLSLNKSLFFKQVSSPEQRIGKPCGVDSHFVLHARLNDSDSLSWKCWRRA